MAFTLPTGIMAGISVLEDYEPAPRTRTVTATVRDNAFDALVASLIPTWNDDKKRSGGVRIPFVTDDEGKTRGGIVATFANAAHHANYSYRVDDYANYTPWSLVKGETCPTMGVVVLFLIPRITRVHTSPRKVTVKVSTNKHEGSGVAA